MRLCIIGAVCNGKFTVTTLKSYFSHCLDCLDCLDYRMWEDSTPHMADVDTREKD